MAFVILIGMYLVAQSHMYFYETILFMWLESFSFEALMSVQTTQTCDKRPYSQKNSCYLPKVPFIL